MLGLGVDERDRLAAGAPINSRLLRDNLATEAMLIMAIVR